MDGSHERPLSQGEREEWMRLAEADARRLALVPEDRDEVRAALRDLAADDSPSHGR